MKSIIDFDIAKATKTESYTVSLGFRVATKQMSRIINSFENDLFNDACKLDYSTLFKAHDLWWRDLRNRLIRRFPFLQIDQFFFYDYYKPQV